MIAKPWKRRVGVVCYVAAGCCAFAAVTLPVLAFIVFLLWAGILVTAAAGSGAMQSFATPVHFATLVHGGPEVLLMFAVLIAGVVGGVGVMVAVLIVVEMILVVSAIAFFVIGRRLRRSSPPARIRDVAAGRSV